MAQEHEIIESLAILAGARLRNAPSREEVQAVKGTWMRVMVDIPDGLLAQAAQDHVLAGEFWPTVAEIRREAYQVQLHNRASAAVNPWAAVPEQSIVWLPSGIEKVKFSPGKARLIAELERKYYDVEDGLPTDEELASAIAGQDLEVRFVLRGEGAA